MLKYPNLVMLALPKWDGPYSSTSFSLAKEFSTKTKTYYIDNPLTLKDFFLLKDSQARKRLKYKLGFKKWERHSDNLVIIYPSVVFPINFLPPGRLYNLLFRINSYLVFRSVKKILKKLKVEDYIYINSFNPFYDHQYQLNSKLFIYHTVDDIKLSPYINKHGHRLEPLMVKMADFTIVTSLKLKRLNDNYSDHVYYLPNAADFNLFNQRPTKRPIELKGVYSEIIIFTGHLDWRTDLDILEGVAENNRDRCLLIIGPVSLNDKGLLRLKTFKNVKFIGPRPIERLSEYLYYSHCAIIPFNKNELTESIYPLKVNEYLSTGIPVVATPFSEDITMFGDVISLASSMEEFNACIDEEIKSNQSVKRDRRIKRAKSNTWTARGNEFWNIVEGYIE